VKQPAQDPPEIFVVRHGQASARARDYDVLSSLGARQAARLGESLAHAGGGFDAVFCGPRRRHRDTARHLVEAARAAGAKVPDAVELPGSDEIPLGAILLLWLPRFVQTDPVARAIAEYRFEHSDDEIRRVLGQAMIDWAAGDVASPSLPTFASFVARIDESLHAVRRAGSRTLLITSAGPMAATLHLGGHAQAATPIDTMKLTVAIENTAVTRVIHEGERVRIADALAIAHLPTDERTLM
jgi:broad specificity phosphatase PhoE